MDVTGAAGVELGVWVAGQMVVYAATVMVLTMVLWAGQEVTVDAQLVTVTRVVVYTTEVTRAGAAEEVVLRLIAEAMPARAAAMNATEDFMLVKVTTVMFLLEGVTGTASAASTGYIDYGCNRTKSQEVGGSAQIDIRRHIKLARAGLVIRAGKGAGRRAHGSQLVAAQN